MNDQFGAITQLLEIIKDSYSIKRIERVRGGHIGLFAEAEADLAAARELVEAAQELNDTELDLNSEPQQVTDAFVPTAEPELREKIAEKLFKVRFPNDFDRWERVPAIGKEQWYTQADAILPLLSAESLRQRLAEAEWWANGRDKELATVERARLAELRTS